MKRTMLFIFGGLVVLLLAACSSGPQAVEYTIEMTEFAYSPETIELSVGQEVTLHLVNNGALEHEVMFGQEVMMVDGHPANFEHHLFEHEEPMVMGGEEHADEGEHMEEGEHTEEGEHMEEDEHGHGGDDHGFMVSIPGNTNETKTITFAVTEEMVGEWEIGCFIDGGSHFEQGMVGKVVVTP